MLYITLYQNRDSELVGFESEGHAEYDEPGSDIVCAGASALVLNCMNSIEALTDAVFTQEFSEEEGIIKFHLTEYDEGALLLMKSLSLGLQEIERNYSEYIDIIFKEV